MNELNQKPPSAKFDSKFDFKWIEFLDTLLYIDQQNILQTTIFLKSSDRQNVHNTKSERQYFEFDDEHVQHFKTTSLSRKPIEQFDDEGKNRKMTNSIENNSSTNKNVMISNLYHYE